MLTGILFTRSQEGATPEAEPVIEMRLSDLVWACIWWVLGVAALGIFLGITALAWRVL